MLYHDTLWFPGRSGGIDHIGKVIRAYVSPVRRFLPISCRRSRLVRFSGEQISPVRRFLSISCRRTHLVRFSGEQIGPVRRFLSILFRRSRLVRFSGEYVRNQIFRKQKLYPGIREHIVYPLLRIVQVYGQIGSSPPRQTPSRGPS